MEYQDFPFDACIRCTICTANCPVAKVTDKYPGPKQMALELGRHRLHTNPIPAGALDYCANCKNCELSCPENIPITQLILEAKRHYQSQTRPKLRDRILSRPALLGRLNAPVAPVTNALLNIGVLRNLMQKTVGISSEAAFPKYSGKSPNLQHSNKNPSSKNVVYFTGCYARYNDPSLIEATVSLLESCGINVVIPQQTCCGLSAVNNNEYDCAKHYAAFNIKSLLDAAGDDGIIITSCTSCALTLKHDYQALFQLDEAEQLAQRIYDVSEFLLEFQGENNTPFKFKKNASILGYHAPCHLKALGIGLPGLELLRLIPEITVKELDGGCCGSAGSYGFKAEKYAISKSIGKNIFDAVVEADIEYVVTECPTCSVRIAQLTDKKIYHPIHLLSDALH